MFYNPAMAGDRDLAVAFVRALPRAEHRERSGWEMTSATGVRGLRLLNETEAFDRFAFSETRPESLDILRQNVERYPGASVLDGDCRTASFPEPFDFVDLDPYGSPAPFVRSAVAAVRSGGVLAVTATDMMVLAGAQPAACLAHYGARPVRGRLGPEGGLRILLAYLARTSEELGRTIRPLLAYCRDHYVRAYLEVDDGVADAMPVESIEPSTWSGPWLGDLGPFGPLWLGPLVDASVVPRLAVPGEAARPREMGSFLARLADEAAVDVPFYYESNVLAARLGLAAPPAFRRIREALASAGYRVGRTHARAEGFRTDAPRTVVEEVARSLSSPGQSQKTRVRA